MVSKRNTTILFLFIFLVLGLIAASVLQGAQVGPKSSQLSVDVMYFAIAVVLCVFALLKDDIEFFRRSVYMFSIIFFFAFIILDPKVAFLSVMSFFIPALFFQKKWINFYVLIFISILSALFLWYKFGYPLLLPLYMPICILVAKQTTSGFQVRYTKNAYDNENILSFKQQKARNLHNRGLVKLFLSHLDNIVSKIAMLGEEKDQTPKNFDELYGSKLLKLQDAESMSLALTAIKKRDPRFDIDDILQYSIKLFKKILNSRYLQQIDTIEYLVSDSLYEQFKHQISDQLEAGIKYKCRKLEIIDQRIAYVNSDKNFDYIVVFIRATTLDSLVDSETNKELVVNEQPRSLIEYWTFIRRPGAKTLKSPTSVSDNCPNCGNPIVIGHATICSSCNSFLRSGDYNWVLSKITQASEWEYLEPSLIKGWEQIKNEDEQFTLQSAEDIALVIFWKIRLARKSNNVKLLNRFASKSICKGLVNLRSRGINTGPYIKGTFDDASYMEDVKLASVRLKAVSMDSKQTRLYILIVWSGIPVKVDENETIEDYARINCLVRDIYVLARKSGVKSNIAHAITSAHCRNCGASSDEAFTSSCKYCGTLLNDEGSSWFLQKIITEKDLEYRNIVGKIRETTRCSNSADHSDISAISIVTVLAQVLIADNKASIEEISFLKKIAAKKSISDEKVNSIVKKLRKGTLYIPTPEGSVEAMNILSLAIKMAMADGKIDDRESKILISLGKHLGQSEKDVKNAIHMVLSQPSCK